MKRSLTAVAAVGFPAIVPARVFGPSAPSNLIQVAQIGCGRIARVSEFPGILRNSDVARYVAVCDLDSISVGRREKHARAGLREEVRGREVLGA